MYIVEKDVCACVEGRRGILGFPCYSKSSYLSRVLLVVLPKAHYILVSDSTMHVFKDGKA